METPFEYSKYVTGKSNIGRSIETQAFVNLLSQGENIVIYEPAKTGKTSLIQQGFINLKATGFDFIPVSIDLLNRRGINEMFAELGSRLIQACASTPNQYEDIVGDLLEATHFVFDKQKYTQDGSILSMSWELDKEDIKAVLGLPYKLAQRCGKRVFVLVDEFQNLLLSEWGEACMRMWESMLKNRTQEDRMLASYIFCGSSYNAMHEIFGVQKHFYRSVERIELNPIETKLIVDHVIKGLLASGKVIDRELLHAVCKLFRNNIWYINHFAAICDSITRGYIMEPTLNAGLEILVSIHTPRYKAIMNDLTLFQINMLRAVLCGENKFTSTEVIEQYGLSSSANVKRLKDALSKKEIVFFGADTPLIIDPLFEYWVRKEFFGIL